jgi:hypothetical protein
VQQSNNPASENGGAKQFQQAVKVSAQKVIQVHR